MFGVFGRAIDLIDRPACYILICCLVMYAIPLIYHGVRKLSSIIRVFFLFWNSKSKGLIL